MKNKIEAIQARSAAADKVKELRAKAEAGTWGEAEQSALNAAKQELETAEATVKRFEELESIESRAAGWTSTPTTPSPVTVNILKSENRGDNPESHAKQFRLFEAISESVYGKGLTGRNAEMDQEGKAQAKRAGISEYGTGLITLPDFMVSKRSNPLPEHRDMLAGTTTAGGFTVQTNIGELIPFLDPRLTVMDMGATYLPGQTGNIDFPRNDAAATVARKTEVAAADETSPTFDRLQLSPVRYTAFTDVSKQVLVQSTIAMENFVRNRLNEALMRVLEQECFTNSDNTGLFDLSGVNDITIGANGGDLNWALTVKFETEVAADNADMGRLGYLFTPQVAAKLKTTKRDDAGNGFIWEGPNSNAIVNGYRAMASNLLPKTLSKGGFTSILHGGLFGNWAELIFAQWGGVDILVNPYTKGKEATVEIIINAWYDHGVRRPQSFTKCDELYPS